MKQMQRLSMACAISVLAMLCSPFAEAETRATGSATVAASAPLTPAPGLLVLVVPVELSTQSLSNGCWAQFYDERNFKGDVLTLLGPTELQALDKAGGRQFKRNLDSLVVGPKATLTVFEHQMFKDKSVQFEPGSKEGGLIRRLGFGGRIESMKLTCAK